MGAEIVSVVVGGRRFAAWERTQVSASMREAARAFRLEAAAERGGRALAAEFRAGAAIEIYLGGDLALAGYVDAYNPSFSALAARVAISGRSKAADAVDCSAVHRTGRFRGRKPAAIAQELIRESGVDVGFADDDEAASEAIDYQLTPGETIFRALEKMYRQQGKTLCGEPDGSIRAVDARRPQRHAGGLFEGAGAIPIKAGEADHNWANRHSRYIVKGQAPVGHGAEALEIEAAARDAAVDRTRPLIVVQDEDTTRARTRRRARNRRDKAAGNALRATVTVQGFRDAAGALWTPGRLVWVESPFLALAQEMLVEGVIFSQDNESGSESKLTLVDPRAHGGKAGKGARSGADWQQSDGEAE